MKPYKPQGIIKQAPACKLNYRGRNSSGGRRIPISYIGAAVQWHSKEPWERGIDGAQDISVIFAIGTRISDAVVLSKNKYA